MPTRSERLELIRALETARGGRKVITYLTSTRANLEAPMAMDAIPVVYEHLRTLGTPKEETKIDLFLHSNGGDGTVPWRLVTLIREFCSEFNVLVPHKRVQRSDAHGARRGHRRHAPDGDARSNRPDC